MANYIHQLQSENVELKQTLANVMQEIIRFNSFLHGPKFQTQEGGERQDWIATGDVHRELETLLATAQGVAF